MKNQMLGSFTGTVDSEKVLEFSINPAQMR